MANFILPTSGTTTHKSVNPSKLSLVTSTDGTVEYTGSDDVSVNLTTQTVASAGKLTTPIQVKLNDTSQSFDGSNNLEFTGLQLGSVEYIESTQASATKNWTGVTKSPALYVGKVIVYHMNVAGTSDAATLNLTLAGGGTTGAIGVKRNGTGNITTHYGAQTCLVLTYDGTAWRTDGDYDSNSNDTSTGYYRYANGTFVTKTALYRYQILLTYDETSVFPINTVSNSTATTKTLTTESFNPFKPIYYYSATSTVSANAAISKDYLWRGRADINLGYSFNTGTTLTSNKDVYLVATMQSNGMAKLATDVDPIAQQIPATENGHIYILLGHAYSTSNIVLYEDHPIFVYSCDSIRLYTQATNGALVKKALGTVNTTANKFLKDTGEWEQVDCGDLTGAADLQAIEALEGTSGLLKKTAANTWTLDTNNYMTEMYMAEYGSSTYAEVLAAYQAKKMVYCRVDKRMAFMAYVNNKTTPTEFEFQYYRSIQTHEDNQQGDQVFVYKLNNSNGGTWTSTTREAYTKVTTGTNMSKSYSNGTLTLSAADPTVKQTVKTDNTNYKLLMGANASPTSGSVYEAAYDTNITVNPSTHTITAANFAGNASTATKFASAQSIALTGDITGSASSQAGWSISTTIGSGKVTNAMLAGSIANNKLTNSSISIAGNSVSLGGSLDASTLTSSLGLSSAMHFIGVATVAITDGSTTNPTITGYDFANNKKAGDVIIDSSSSREYVWTSAGKWELLGGDSSYKTTQTAVTKPTAVTNTWVSGISQDANGVISVDYASLVTTGTWSGTATKATQDGSGNNIVNTYLTKAAGVTAVAWDTSNKKITRTINGSVGDVIQFIAGSNISLTAESGKLTIASSYTNTDTLVKQTVKTDNVNYKLLATTSNVPSSGTAMETTYSANVYANPSTGAVSAIRHTFNISGTDKAYATYNNTDQSIDFIFV